MPADSIIKTGDMIRFTMAPPAIIPPIMAPIPLMGTSANVFVNNMPACLEGDELPLPLRVPLPYTAGNFSIPGMGLLSVRITPANKTMFAKNGRPILIKGTPFMAEFQVTVPAMQPMVPSPIPDPMVKKMGTAEFVTTNLTIKAG